MADNIPFKQSNGGFTSEGITEGVIAVGNTGTLLDVPEVNGKTFKLFLLQVAGATGQTGISLIINGVTIENQGTLEDPEDNPLTGIEFSVNRAFSSDISLGFKRKLYTEITCTSFSVVKNAGNTTQEIAYAYETGV